MLASLALALSACGGGGGGGTLSPSLTGISPASCPVGGGTAVTLTGTGFQAGATVGFGGAAGTAVAVASATSIIATCPARAAGPLSVVVTNADGQVSNGLTFTYQVGTPPPGVGSVSPASGSTAGGRTVSIAGSSFSASPANPRVSFGGDFATVVTATATLIIATVPAHAPGTVAVTVENPDTQTATLPFAFTYVAPPVVASLSPTSGSTGGGERIDLTGTSFDMGTAPVVTFGNTPALVADAPTATSITIVTPPHGEGVVDVTVTNSDGLASTLVNGFTYKAPAGNAPTVRNVTNDATGLPSGAAAGGEAVTLTGTNFAPGATVHFGAAAATDVAFVSTTSLTATTPLAQPGGTVDVTVALPGTGLAGTIARGFTFLLAAPRVTTLSVTSSTPAGGGLLLVKGLNLQASSTVTFGEIKATVTEFMPGVPPGGDVLTVIVPPSPLLPGVTDGFVSVVVGNPDGQSSTLAPSVSPDGTPWPANFHYGPPPVVDGFSPSTGRGLDVTLTGTGFSSDATGARSGMQVLMSGPSFDILRIRRCPNAADPACLPGVVSPTPTSLVVTIPSSQLNPGNYGFIVTNFDGQSAMAPGAFVVP